MRTQNTSTQFNANQSIPLSQVRGIGGVLLKRFAALEIHDLQDVLWHLPYRYEDRTRFIPFKSLKVGETVFIQGEIIDVETPLRGKTKLICHLSDGSEQLLVRFFHFNPRQIQLFQSGRRLRCYGVIKEGFGGLELLHPEWQLLFPHQNPALDAHLKPIYSSVSGLTQSAWFQVTTQALRWMQTNAAFLDGLSLFPKFQEVSLKTALLQVHRPSPSIFYDEKSLQQARDRIAMDELAAFRLGLLQLRNRMKQLPGIALSLDAVAIKQFQNQLPFELTQAQKKVAEEIEKDLSNAKPMLRLLQGDVGSGKTVIAALAAFQAVSNQYQVAVMAPTEILARQQFETFQHYFSNDLYSIQLLSGKINSAQRKKILTELSMGNIHILIGTHALFQESVEFQKLGLVIIDEQHRFGVAQRAQLKNRVQADECVPHQLMMTATPIPRTLGLTLYAGLDCSILNELPKDRIPIHTSVISVSKRLEVMERVKQACLEGRQAYWVCPLIQHSEHIHCQTVENSLKSWEKMLPAKSLGVIHGRLSTAEKIQVMQAFRSGEIQLLIATTVIEVGVNVPNASLMIIENAERMGVAQLHQLRGRVGRGKIASHCILLYQEPLSELARARLKALRESCDGFELAESDLQLRGVGELLGKQQSGQLSFKVVAQLPESSVLKTLQSIADEIEARNPACIDAWLARWKQAEWIEPA